MPLPLDTPFDYAIDDGPALQPGDYVEVPFGPRQVVGVVWDAAADRRIPAARLKSIGRRLEAPPMPAPLRALVTHLAAITLHPLGSALKLALSVPAALEPPPPKLGLVPQAGAEGVRLSAARRRVLDAALQRAPQTAAALARAAGVSAGVVQTMVKAGLLRPAPLPDEGEPALELDRAGTPLSEDQARVAGRLAAAVGRGHRTLLLEGLPGAGKTEVYLEAVTAALGRGGQALVLLPEIALTSQVLERFERRFGRPPAVWHSEIGSSARRRLWRRIAEGREPIVIGARSALFLPLPALGLIVVDEEHDGSFKQDDGVAYQARDMAIARARLEDCPVVLVSATPALETAWQAQRTASRCARRTGPPNLILPARHGGAAMPEVGLIDLRHDRPPRGAWLAPTLRAALRETLAAGEQALLFLNRRGFAAHPVPCLRHRLRCPNCSAWLVTHRLRQRLLCHHCG